MEYTSQSVGLVKRSDVAAVERALYRHTTVKLTQPQDGNRVQVWLVSASSQARETAEFFAEVQRDRLASFPFIFQAV